MLPHSPASFRLSDLPVIPPTDPMPVPGPIPVNDPAPGQDLPPVEIPPGLDPTPMQMQGAARP